jgi:hypothetical protein
MVCMWSNFAWLRKHQGLCEHLQQAAAQPHAVRVNRDSSCINRVSKTEASQWWLMIHSVTARCSDVYMSTVDFPDAQVQLSGNVILLALTITAIIADVEFCTINSSGDSIALASSQRTQQI